MRPSLAVSTRAVPCVLRGKFADLQNLCFVDSASGRGAFAEYVKAFSDLVWKIPQGTFSFEQAVATGSPYVTYYPPVRSFPHTGSLI